MFIPQRCHRITGLPQLRQNTPNSLFMDDNASPTCCQNCQSLTSESGRGLIWLASNDLNPIEHVWDQLNSHVNN
uniref:Tc1-like transposase DDE domain-containing protein n=1 Tax=Oryzias latipes TaxID=8090 RepID=A0A3P9MP67_ORYLA